MTEAGAGAKIGLCIASIMNEIQIIEQEIDQSSSNPKRK
jgi:hypothetical protein